MPRMPRRLFVFKMYRHGARMIHVMQMSNESAPAPEGGSPSVPESSSVCKWSMAGCAAAARGGVGGAEAMTADADDEPSAPSLSPGPTPTPPTLLLLLLLGIGLPITSRMRANSSSSLPAGSCAIIFHGFRSSGSGALG
eukprot:COSAG01_NODE_9996_length_2280_cov_1.793214_3_plen_138_part_01